MGLDYAVENGVSFSEIGAHSAKGLFADGFFNRSGGNLRLGCKRGHVSADGVEVLQDRIDLATVGSIGRLAQRRKHVLDRVGTICDLGLLDDTGCALERM